LTKAAPSSYGTWRLDTPHTYDPEGFIARFYRAGQFAGRCNFENAHVVEIKHMFSGDEKAFNGVSQWPAVEATVQFNAGETVLAAQFAVQLRTFIEAFLKEHRL